MKQELNKKVNDLIKKGTTVKDPLAARQETVSNLLSLESEIISLRLKLTETKKLQNILNKELKINEILFFSNLLTFFLDQRI